MAFSETLAQRVRVVLAGTQGVTEKRMFGGLAFLKHGHMFVGVTGEDLMARVGKEHEPALSPDCLLRAISWGTAVPEAPSPRDSIVRPWSNA